MLKRRIFYRGSLSSCNYSCDYCPLSLTKNTQAELRYDKAELYKFLGWIKEQRNDFSYGVLFTPWGEAMIRNYYQDAFIELSHQANIHRVCAQTNLSGELHWLHKANKEKSALWISYHPDQLRQKDFLQKCRTLLKNDICFSVGVVGLKENKEQIKQLRSNLPESVYLWINAYKDQENYYTQADIDYFMSIDPLFKINLINYKSFSKACQAGDSSFVVGTQGDIKRCHFVEQVIGNLYTDELDNVLQAMSCPNQRCECYIGYINLQELNLASVYGEGLLERVPIEFPQINE